MALDSKVVFSSRVTALGLADLLPGLIQNGWDSMGAFAFSSNYAPGQADDTKFIQDVVVKLTGEEDSVKKPALRRLHFESFSLVAADMAARSSRIDEDEKPRKLPGVEREARLEIFRAKVSGILEIEGELEPSSILIDKAHHMMDTGELKHLRWDELTKRDDEIKGIKNEPIFKLNAQGCARRRIWVRNKRVVA